MLACNRLGSHAPSCTLSKTFWFCRSAALQSGLALKAGLLFTPKTHGVGQTVLVIRTSWKEALQ